VRRASLPPAVCRKVGAAVVIPMTQNQHKVLKNSRPCRGSVYVSLIRSIVVVTDMSDDEVVDPKRILAKKAEKENCQSTLKLYNVRCVI
jgi:hypothetical protein